MHAEIDAGFDALARQVADAAIKAHEAPGTGLFESVHETCLVRAHPARSVPMNRQLALPISHDGHRLDSALHLDLVVGERLIVELKSVDALLPIHQSRLMTCLKLSCLRPGLFINFNARLLGDGIKRIAL